MIVGFVKGLYIIKYETNSIFGYRYDITDGVHIIKTVFSNDYTAPLKMVDTIANSDGLTIQHILIG